MPPAVPRQRSLRPPGGSGSTSSRRWLRVLRLRHLALVVGLILLSACGGNDEATAPDDASRSLYVLGDSWAELMHDQVQVELDDRGFDGVALRRFGAGGSTMSEWADADGELMSAVTGTLIDDPTPEPVVLMTLGGNDLLNAGATPESVERDFRDVVAALTNARPDVVVVLGSYDILNPAIAREECDELFEVTLGVTDVADITRIFREQWAALESSEAAASAAVVTVDAYGTLQGSPGDPDVSSPSPTEFLLDCIHLNDDGEDVYLDEVFDQAITSALCRTEEATAC